MREAQFELREHNAYNFDVLSQDCFSYLGSFVCPSSVKNAIDILMRACMLSLFQFNSVQSLGYV